ncbi:penicillin-binding protein 2 [soil metagenome]
MSPFHPHARRRRALLSILVVLLTMGTLGAAFFRTQVIRNSDYALRAEDNRLRMLPILAPRGTIYDRNGEIIAETLASYALFLIPAPPDTLRTRLARLAPHLDLEPETIEQILGRFRKKPHEPVLVSNALNFEQVSWIEEHRPELPWVLLDSRPLRSYPQGNALAHLIGYVAEISERELADSLTWKGYRLGQHIGKAGIERYYERLIGGKMGARFMEVDARGRVVGSFAPKATVPAVPGEDLHLTLDVELQRFAARIFPKDGRGAIVAMVPRTGEILALYSHPTYDPNLLIGGVTPRVWRALNEDASRPLLNRTTHGIYPPGSTWKLATAVVGLEKGVINAQTRMPYACTGGLSYAGRYSRCWRAGGHGSLDLAGAIAHSCNVYFYQLGIRLGLNQLAKEGTRLGFSRRTGIDLPSEKVGTFPEDAEWFRKRFGWTPTPSEVMSLSIGQGPNAQTPIRMAQFFAALAGDGTAPTPHLLAARPGEKLPLETDLKISPQTLRAVREGLARVTAPGGTAYMASLQRWKLYGKTGTSQNSQDLKKPHAWFTGFAGPIDGEPEIVVAVVVEFGESGSQAAAPLAAKVADFYLNRKHGFPTEELQTLGERLRAGRPAAAPRREEEPPIPAPSVIGIPRPRIIGVQ